MKLNENQLRGIIRNTLMEALGEDNGFFANEEKPKKRRIVKGSPVDIEGNIIGPNPDDIYDQPSELDDVEYEYAPHYHSGDVDDEDMAYDEKWWYGVVERKIANAVKKVLKENYGK